MFAFAGHLPLHFTVVDIIQNVEVASAVLNPSRLEFANSSHNTRCRAAEKTGCFFLKGSLWSAKKKVIETICCTHLLVLCKSSRPL